MDSVSVDQFWVDGSAGGPLSVRMYRPVVPSGRSAVLVHGFGSSARSNWVRSGWVAALTREGISTFTLDLPGHGDSARPHENAAYTLAGLVRDVTSVVEATPGWGQVSGPVDLIGYSLGARLVVEVAARPDDANSAADGGVADIFPAMPAIGRMVLGGYAGGPLLTGVDEPALRRLLAAAPGTPARVSRTDLVDGTPVGAGVAEEVGVERDGIDRMAATRRIAAIARALPENDPAALVALVGGLLADGAITRPAPVPIHPALVAVGARDPIAHDVATWAGLMPAARFLQISGRDHISAVTAAGFRSAATDFLASGTVDDGPGAGRA